MLALSDEQKADLAQRMRTVVAGTSWDKTAEAMHKLIQTTPPGNRAQRLSADLADIAGAGNVSALPLSSAHKQAVHQVEIDAQPKKAQAAE
jgi:hypothetical protein